MRYLCSQTLTRHARACRGHPRLNGAATKKDVDGRDKPGHDDAGKSTPTLYSKLGRELLEAGGGEIHRNLGGGLSGAGAVLVRPRHMGGGQAERRGRLEVVAVRGDHHALAGSEVESPGGGEIDPRLGLVVARDLGAKDGVPRQAVAAG